MTNVRETGNPIPMNEYSFEITDKTDKTSRNGDPMINIELTVLGGEFKGNVVYDNILIPKADSPAVKILGRTKHFLHCIGEPYEGEFEWDSDAWVGKSCKAYIGHEEPNQYHRSKKEVVAEYLHDEDGAAQEALQNKVAEETKF